MSKYFPASLTQASPSLSEVRTLLAKYPEANVVPVFKEFNADLETPVSAFLKVKRGRNSFLLESVEGGENIARFSFIGTQPYKVLEQNGQDPLIQIQAEVSAMRPVPIEGLPEFTGGGVGYVGYECVQYFEPTVQFGHQKDVLQIPESVFLFMDSLLIFDNVSHTIKVVSHCRADSKSSAADQQRAYEKALANIDILVERLAGEMPPRPRVPATPRDDKHPDRRINVGEEGYKGFVNSLKQHIVDGDIFQAVPSQRITRRLDGVNAFDIYRQLRVINPSPYMFFVELENFDVVGASPETLVKVDEDRTIFNYPIAGTRRRGKTQAEDEALAKELLADEKERAEHIMLVDLGRNDVGRVSTPGTVRVEDLMHIEKYSHVMHIVSIVKGELAEGLTPFDAFRSVFPAGTVSGAPKIRAMQLVSELETERRGIYAGAVGYVSFQGVLDMCIAIRSVVVRDGNAYLQAGGGIVYDSEAEFERQETVNKMMAVDRAIDQAQKCRQAHPYHATRNKNVGGDNGDAAKERAIRQDPRYGHEDDPLSELSLQDRFGEFGGKYVPETLVEPLAELETAYLTAIQDPAFHEELRHLYKDFVGRPTPLFYAQRLTEHCGGARIFLKREDLAHTGAHKINAALGMGLLAQRMGKKRIIAETGAGQHGVATATACAFLGLECHVYMGAEDCERQQLNVFRMKLLGAEVIPVMSGTRTLKDAVNEAMRDWVTNVADTFFLIGSVVGPHPFPTLVRNFQSIIGRETRQQILAKLGALPDAVIACVGGGSNAIGIFHAFIKDPSVRLIGVEAAGHGVVKGKSSEGQHAATIGGGSLGVLHGTKTILLQDENGQVAGSHSISAGLDYPGVGPEHAHLAKSGRAQYVNCTDTNALEGMKAMSQREGIIPALESSHAIWYAMQEARRMTPDQTIIINVSGRGDKDMPQVMKILGSEFGVKA